MTKTTLDQIAFDGKNLTWSLYLSINDEQIKVDITQNDAATIIFKVPNAKISVNTANNNTYYCFS